MHVHQARPPFHEVPRQLQLVRQQRTPEQRVPLAIDCVYIALELMEIEEAPGVGQVAARDAETPWRHPVGVRHVGIGVVLKQPVYLW